MAALTLPGALEIYTSLTPSNGQRHLIHTMHQNRFRRTSYVPIIYSQRLVKEKETNYISRRALCWNAFPLLLVTSEGSYVFSAVLQEAGAVRGCASPRAQENLVNCRHKMLPTTLVGKNQGNGTLSARDAARHTAGAKRYKYLRRLFHFRQMDFEFAVWQMLYLFTSPQRVYRNFHYRKQTKDQWARDDPAFLVLLSIWLCVSTLGFGFVLDMGILQILKLLLWVVFIDCVGVGLLIATLMWFVSNKYLVKRHGKDYDVEWGYAFDVHLNAFYPLLVILHFIQLFFINHVILTQWFLGYFIGNTFWLVAIGYYIYITFLGYSALPFLKNTVILLYPFAALIFLYGLSLALGWNFTAMLSSFYKYRVN